MIKVQHPGIDKIIASDLAVLRMLALLMEKYLPESRPLNPIQMVEEFANCKDQELDFILEATNMARFSRVFANDPSILVPMTYWELTYPRILVMEYIDGIPLDEIDRLLLAGVDLERIAQRLLRAFLKQIFQFGFYQADPHPGNFLALSDDRIAFIDFGLVGYINLSSIATFSIVPALQAYGENLTHAATERHQPPIGPVLPRAPLPKRA